MAGGSPGVRPDQLNRDAFEQRWFGAKSLGRIRVLIPDLKARYDAFPAAFAILRRWPDMDPLARRIICHWHLQLSDIVGSVVPRGKTTCLVSGD